ncbi:hypothetical protein [Glutamicibacter ardleyensis]|uniref:hypothetical protein n=1 Tax=Glutamicibacter ardleyensis TaxID=225894 RepID=UPI003FD5F42D
MTRQNTVPSRHDAFLRKFTDLIGGPLGKHSNPGRINPGFFTIDRVLLLLTEVAALLAVASKNACRLHGWTALFGARGFADEQSVGCEVPNSARWN